MIELSRRVGQSIIVGDIEITIKNVNIADKQVCVGINAPKDISVYRAQEYEEATRQAEEIFNNFLQ